MKQLMLIVAFLTNGSQLFAADPKAAPKGSNGGRFQIIQVSDYRRDQFLIDSQSGNLWSKVCMSGPPDDCQYSAFMKIDIEDVNLSRKEIFKKMEANDALLEKIRKAKEAEQAPKE